MSDEMVTKARPSARRRMGCRPADIDLKDIVRNSRVCVTGGAGFIGSHLCEVLSAHNDVVVLENFATGKRENLKGIDVELVEGSIMDPKALEEAFNGVRYVFHEAALASVPRSVADPLASNTVNAEGTLRVLMAARDMGVHKVVYASSSSVYGDTPTMPKEEEMKQSPLSPYAVAKLAGEQYCQVFWHVYKLRTAALRYFNVFGPRQDPNSQYSAVIPKFIDGALAHRPLTIFGDGEQTRDFTYVLDVVQANLLAAVLEESNGQVMNIARQERISLNDLAKLIFKETGWDGKITYAPERMGDVKHSLADISKAKMLLGYSSKYTVEEGIRLTVESAKAR
jgi:nucleoside-diphosphate-sugar epimerase